MDSFSAFSPFDSNRSWDELFQRPVRGGAPVRRPKVEPEAVSGEDIQEPEKVPDPQDAERPKSKLFNPQWSREQGYFDEKISLSVEGELPPENSHLTRVVFTVHAVKGGEQDRIGSQEAHLKDGKAVAEIQLFTPQFKDEDGNPVAECEYAFTAKHRDGPEIESGKLKGTKKNTTFIEIELTLDDGKTPRPGVKYLVTAGDGQTYEGETDKDGRARIEPVASREATVAFPELGGAKAKGKGKGAARAFGSGGTSPFYLRIHMDPAKAKAMEEKFILIGGDGSFSQTRTADDDLILGDDFIDLRFADLPTDLAYSLQVEGKGSDAYYVFKDVPFEKLDGFMEAAS